MAFRILSLDGGGPWALIQACALDRLYPGLTGHQILGKFDLAIANSGGSITLAGLIKDLTPAQIRDLFLDEHKRGQIFVQLGWVQYEVDKVLGIGPKWDAAAKANGLLQIMNTPPGKAVGGMRMDVLSDLVKQTTARDIQLIIAAFDYDRNREVFFRSRASTLSSNAARFVPTLAGAVHASSNAPVNYFDAPADVPDATTGIHRRFWDGAIGGYNNPVLAGVLEALRSGVKATDISALSLGTATIWQPVGAPQHGETRDLFRAVEEPGTLADLKKLAASILDDPPDAATLDAHIITGAQDSAPRIVRLSPLVRPQLDAITGVWSLPPGFAKFPQNPHPIDVFRDLRDMPMDAVDQDQVNLIHALAERWIAGDIWNQPIRQNSDTAVPEIGNAVFADGAAAWAKL